MLSIHFTGLSGQFIKEIQIYIKQLFLSGQNDLQSRELDKEKEDKAGKLLKKFKLMVLTNAVCVDILVWATKDENGNYFFCIFQEISFFSPHEKMANQKILIL